MVNEFIATGCHMKQASLQSVSQRVLIVGAGPVGLVAAIDLAQRGVPVTVIERRATPDSLTVRCNHIAARSMEIFRRLGFAHEVRGAGFHDDFPHDVAIRLNAVGADMGRIPIPGRGGRQRGDPGPDTGWPTVEPPHRMNQIFLEPILHRVAARTPGLTLCLDTELIELTDNDQGVCATVRSQGATRTLEAAYLIGCDGGSSLVRKHIGAVLEGDPLIQHVQSTFIHAPGLTQMMRSEAAWGILNINLRRCGTIYTIDNDDRFLVHNYVLPGETFDTVDRDACLRTILGVDKDFRYTVLRVEDWTGKRLMANKMAHGRIFLAGDSAHLWVPMAGYGMNAGIADATGLTWLLDGVLHGWLAPEALQAYQAERLPITEQVSHQAMRTAETMIKNRAAVPPTIEDATPEGAAARQAYGAQTAALNTPQYCCAGLNFGYYYDHSPLVVYDDEPPPGYSMAEYTPSTVPGCRFAHVVMPDGSSLYDHLGPGYTLVRTQPHQGAGLLRAAHEAKVPLTVLDLAPSSLHDHALYVVRPDQHVAWRAQHDPAAPQALWHTLTGRALA